MTFNNIVSGDRVFIGSREDINHLSPETEDNLTADQSHPLLSVSVILAPCNGWIFLGSKKFYNRICNFLKISRKLGKIYF